MATAEPQRQSGFTLIEMMVALGILLLGVTALLAALSGGADLYQILGVDQPASTVERALASKFEWPAHLPEQPDRVGLTLVGGAILLRRRRR